MSIRLYTWTWEWSGWRWFNLSGPTFIIRRYPARPIFIWPWGCFNRHAADGDHWWGVGIVQIGNRHLFYVGHSGVSIFFIGRTE